MGALAVSCEALLTDRRPVGPLSRLGWVVRVVLHPDGLVVMNVGCPGWAGGHRRRLDALRAPLLCNQSVMGVQFISKLALHF